MGHFITGHYIITRVASGGQCEGNQEGRESVVIAVLVTFCWVQVLWGLEETVL